MDLDLNCVHSWLVLVQQQHFGRAAERLNLTPSALSKRVQRLERQVGAPLVVRDPGGRVELTPAGHRFRGPAAKLLEHAESARRAAATEPRRSDHELVLGVPAGPLDFIRPLLCDAMKKLRLNWPRARLVCRSVPFPSLTSSLLGREIDVLWTVAPVSDPAAISVPLGLTVPRVGLVNVRHQLAQAEAVGAAEFAAQPMLFNPSIPEEWMSVFYLGDIRPRSDAHLVGADPKDMPSVVREARRHGTVTVAPAMLAAFLPPHVHQLRLDGAPPIQFYAAHRRRDTRGIVRSLVEALTVNERGKQLN